jgi:ribosomal protein L37AE/L43A
VTRRQERLAVEAAERAARFCPLCFSLPHARSDFGRWIMECGHDGSGQNRPVMGIGRTVEEAAREWELSVQDVYDSEEGES